MDPAEVATGWEEREAPRLLCCYHRLVVRRPAFRIPHSAFRRYLAGNIARGFAVAQFLREHVRPLLSPLTDRTALGLGEAENQG